MLPAPRNGFAANDDDGAGRGGGGSGGADDALWDGFWRVVALDGWGGTRFRRVAAESGVPLAALRARFTVPRDAVVAYGRRVDRIVLAGTVPAAPGEAVRDRLFDLLMRRFDALRPHRAGVLRLRDHLTRDPLLAALLYPSLLASMAWTLEAAEVDLSGLSGAARAHGLVAVWLDASRAWAEDESEDLGPTMAALDRALDRAERVARTVGLSDGDASEAAAALASPILDGSASGTPPADPFGDVPPAGPEAGGYDGGASAGVTPLDLATPPLPPTPLAANEGEPGDDEGGGGSDAKPPTA